MCGQLTALCPGAVGPDLPLAQRSGNVDRARWGEGSRGWVPEKPPGSCRHSLGVKNRLHLGAESAPKAGSPPVPRVLRGEGPLPAWPRWVLGLQSGGAALQCILPRCPRSCNGICRIPWLSVLGKFQSVFEAHCWPRGVWGAVGAGAVAGLGLSPRQGSHVTIRTGTFWKDRSGLGSADRDWQAEGRMRAEATSGGTLVSVSR